MPCNCCHWAPERAVHSTASIKVRQALSLPTYTSGCCRRNSRILCQVLFSNRIRYFEIREDCSNSLKCQQNLVIGPNKSNNNITPRGEGVSSHRLLSKLSITAACR